VVDTADGVQLPTRLVKTGLDGNVTTIRLRDIKTNTGDAAKQPIFDVTEPTGTGWLKDIKPLEKK
jgi:hypothetical protein